ncbi:hypothetical protein EON64_12865 [archaeon]|nr:MAG: hypothetical protein EON64_12865 [archaeon]
MDPLLVLQPEVARRVRKLRAMHDEYETMHGEYKAERIALERKFLARKEEMFAKRKAIVTGEQEVETTSEGKVATCLCLYSSYCCDPSLFILPSSFFHQMWVLTNLILFD